MTAANGLAEVLAAHEPHAAQGGIFCECGERERYYGGLGSSETYAAHVATAVLAWLETLAQDEAVREAALVWWERASDDERFAAREGYDAAVTAFLAAAKDAR